MYQDELATELINNDLDRCNRMFEADNLPLPQLIWMPNEDDLPEESLKFIHKLWHQHCANGTPPYSIFTPENLFPALGHIIVLEVVDGGLDFKYRVYGTKIAEVSKFDMMGKSISEIPTANAIQAFFFATYRAVLIKKQPLYTMHTPPITITTKKWLRLILPTIDENGDITRLVAGNIPVKR